MTDTTQYRVRWEVDIFARNRMEAAREAEAIMREPIDGDPAQARVMDVRPASSPFWTRLDLANPKLTLIAAPILPPEREYARARPWKEFHNTFAPVEVGTNDYIVEPCDVPKGTDRRLWWTVVDYAPDSNRFYVVPGFRYVNRLGYVQCLRPWGGNPDDHPLYVYQ